MSDLSKPQDPNELFDVVTVDGPPTGIVKARSAVHRDGDWHRAVHVWVVGIDGDGPFLTLQRRSWEKDTQPGKLDATVGGHVRAGEDLDQTLREVEEEIGVAVSRGDLAYAGMRICVHDSETGIHDHELQDVFFLRDERPLTGFRPSPAELAGLLRVQIPSLLDYLTCDAISLQARWVATDSECESTVTIRRDELVARIDRYLYRVAIAARLFLAGERHFSV